ncbi:hypothetical protein NC651_036815 [Populus alba x Populus x berolinensis]|nr:hypothetical protein NC651_036815 [Populus alba x Populus x berolinensis]
MESYLFSRKDSSSVERSPSDNVVELKAFEMLSAIPGASHNKKKLLGLSSIWVLGICPKSSLTAIKELVPGDSGGKTAFSDVKILAGMTGFGAEMN